MFPFLKEWQAHINTDLGEAGNTPLLWCYTLLTSELETGRSSKNFRPAPGAARTLCCVDEANRHLPALRSGLALPREEQIPGAGSKGQQGSLPSQRQVRVLLLPGESSFNQSFCSQVQNHMLWCETKISDIEQAGQDVPCASECDMEGIQTPGFFWELSLHPLLFVLLLSLYILTWMASTVIAKHH